MYTWRVTNLKYKLEDNFGRRQVVTLCHYEAQKAGGDFVVRYNGTVELPAPGDTFVAWEDLTEELVASWVKVALGDKKVIEIEQTLTSRLDEMLNPTEDWGAPWHTVDPETGL